MENNVQLLKHIELLIGSIGVILSLFFGLFLFINRKQQPKANIFLSIYLLAFSLRIGKSLFYNYFPIDPVIRNIFLGVLLTIGPSLWFYTNYLTKPDVSHKRYKLLIHYVPALLNMSFCWAIPNDGTTTAQLFYSLLILHMVTYTVVSLIWLYTQSKSGVLNESIKKWLYYFISVTLFMLIIYFLVSNHIIPYYMGTAFLFSAIIIFFGIWALKTPFLFKVNKKKYSNSTLSYDESVRQVDKLERLMKSEKLFLNPNLTLAKTSAQLEISTKQLSQAINQVYKINFSQYIANFRVEEAKRLLHLAEYSDYKISTIAYDSGFNSISSFNSTFKKLTRITAIEYRQTLQS
ncbi:MAG: helix-turn-helix domain-containing protein [Maribacter litoralis]|uniref:helix-turn-helix domain-containing protein n=1 Tax=Maribacter litoralis TaxID=2059726 RepID=UPI0032996F3F